MDKQATPYLSIEVACATPERQQIIPLKTAPNTTLIDAIHQSHILDFFPELNIDNLSIGVWSQVKKPTDRVKQGDRIEIYRPLTIDPKEARRQRAAKKKSNH